MADRHRSEYEWLEVSPGRYERDLDEVEQFYATLAKLYGGTGHSLFAITGFVEVSLPISVQDHVSCVEQRIEDAFRAAWRRLRFDHPNLASFVEYDPSKRRCKRIYERLKSDDHGESEAQWLESSFKTINSGQSGRVFANTDPPVQKHATLYLITPPITAKAAPPSSLKRDVVFRCPHVTIDGIGTYILLDNLMAHVARAYNRQGEYTNANFGQEIRNLSPPLRIAARIPSKVSQAQLDRLSGISMARAALRKNIELISIPFDHGAEPPRESRRVEIQIGTKEVTALKATCRTMDISITQAFHAAIVLAVRDLQERNDRDRKGRYINFCLVNLRPQCSPPYNSTSHPASVYHSVPANSLAVDVTIPAKDNCSVNVNDEYNSIVTKIKEYYLAVKSDPDFVAMTPLLYSTFLTPPYPEEPHSKIPLPNQSPSVSISSMGIVDEIIQPDRPPFTLSAPWVTANEYRPGVGVFLATWKGEMTLSAVFNIAFHEEAKIVKFLKDVQQTLLIGLDLPPSTVRT